MGGTYCNLQFKHSETQVVESIKICCSVWQVGSYVTDSSIMVSPLSCFFVSLNLSRLGWTVKDKQSSLASFIRFMQVVFVEYSKKERNDEVHWKLLLTAVFTLFIGIMGFFWTFLENESELGLCSSNPFELKLPKWFFFTVSFNSQIKTVKCSHGPN